MGDILQNAGTGRLRFALTLLAEALPFLYIVFLHPLVLGMIGPLSWVDHEGKTVTDPAMPGAGLAWLLLGAAVLETVGFLRLRARQGHKWLIILASGIPRLFLYWEIVRTVNLALTQELGTGRSLLLFFLTPFLLVVVAAVFFLTNNEPEPRAGQGPAACGREPLFDLPFLLGLPLYCLWYTLFERVQLPGLWNGSAFVFVGVYSVFMYLPLRLPWVIRGLRRQRLPRWRIGLLVAQPVVVYLLVYSRLAHA